MIHQAANFVHSQKTRLAFRTYNVQYFGAQCIQFFYTAFEETN